MGQKDGKKWTAAVDLQPTLPKSDRLLGVKVSVVAKAFWILNTRHSSLTNRVRCNAP